MITIEQIKQKLIEMEFKVLDSPKYDSYTGEKLQDNNFSAYYKEIGEVCLQVKIDNLSYGSCGILASNTGINLFLQNQQNKIVIQFWWNLFLQLLEEQTK